MRAVGLATLIALLFICHSAEAQVTVGHTDSLGNAWVDPSDPAGPFPSWFEITQVCPTDGVTPCSGSLDGIDVTGWIWATAHQVLELFREVTGLNSGQLQFGSQCCYLGYTEPGVYFADDAIALLSPNGPPPDPTCGTVGAWPSTTTLEQFDEPPYELLVGYHAYILTACPNDWVEFLNLGISSDRVIRPWLYRAAGGTDQVTIDIIPGKEPNRVRLFSRAVPVAILTTDTFDATTVIPASVTLAGASVYMKGDGQTAGSLQDVNGDGDVDLVVYVSAQQLALTPDDTEAVLTGTTTDGVAIQGSDTVQVVP